MFLIFSTGPSDKCKALYIVNYILVLIVNFIHLLCSSVLNWSRAGSFLESLSVSDLLWAPRATEVMLE